MPTPHEKRFVNGDKGFPDVVSTNKKLITMTNYGKEMKGKKKS